MSAALKQNETLNRKPGKVNCPISSRLTLGYRSGLWLHEILCFFVCMFFTFCLWWVCSGDVLYGTCHVDCWMRSWSLEFTPFPPVSRSGSAVANCQPLLLIGSRLLRLGRHTAAWVWAAFIPFLLHSNLPSPSPTRVKVVRHCLGFDAGHFFFLF